MGGKKMVLASSIHLNSVLCDNFLSDRYSIDAFLDSLLSKQLLVGKLFVGQKLRVLHLFLHLGVLFD